MILPLTANELGSPLGSDAMVDFHNTLIINITSNIASAQLTLNTTTYPAPTTVDPGNDSSTEYYDYEDYHDDLHPSIYVLFILLSGLVFLAGLIGNCLVWFAVWRNPRMRSATNMFLVNLALADFLVVLICLPATVAEDITGIWYLGWEMCKVIKCLQQMSVFVSVMTLTAISMERWMAICRPLFFRPTTMVALRTIVIIWVISLLCIIPQGIVLDLTQVSETEYICKPSWPPESEAIQLWIVFIAFYVVPLAIMTFTYVKIALCLWTSGLPDGDNDEASANVPRAQLLLRRKKAKMLIMVVAMFALCFLPVHVLFILMYTDLMRYFPSSSIKPLFLTCHWLVYFSSTVNPIIYNFMSCNFRREFLIACHICCRRGSNHNSVYEGRTLLRPKWCRDPGFDAAASRQSASCLVTYEMQRHRNPGLCTTKNEMLPDVKFPPITAGAVRMRKFRKFQNRGQQHRACGRNGVSADATSMTLQTQSSVLGNMASSSYSLCSQQPLPAYTPQSTSGGANGNGLLYVPGNRTAGGCGGGGGGGGGGDSNNISPCSSRRSSPSGSMRNHVLQKNHFNHNV